MGRMNPLPILNESADLLGKVGHRDQGEKRDGPTETIRLVEASKKEVGGTDDHELPERKWKNQ